MVLPFKPQFVPKILSGQKIHTIREDKGNRWKPGRKIHMATGVRTKNYKCFKEATCVSVQEIVIDWFAYGAKHRPDVRVAGRSLYAAEVMQLAYNDGFDSMQAFFEWFSEDFIGKIIYWEDTEILLCEKIIAEFNRQIQHACKHHRGYITNTPDGMSKCVICGKPMDAR